MRKAILQAVVLFLLLVAPFAVLTCRWQTQAEREAPVRETVDPAPAESEEVREVSARQIDGGPPESAGDGAENPVFADWEASFGESRASTRFRDWQEKLESLPREQALELLRAYWESGRDLETGSPFAPGEGGRLVSAPTLRTAVLDLLGDLDPASAHALAAEALEAPKSSAAEYALHLRNYAWGAPETMTEESLRSYLGEKAQELVNHRPWQDAPSSGYQEAFDVLVWAEAVEAVPTLAGLMASGAPQALVHPAGFTLDRLVVNKPRPVLQSLEDRPGLLDDRPLAKAGYFARADPADPVQREALESYYLAEERTGEQRDYLLSLLPNLNLRLSHNLLSETISFSHDEVIGRLRSTRTLLGEWTDDPRFTAWQQEIARAHARLDETLEGTDEE